MRYPQGGGLTAERQEFREGYGCGAAAPFARDEASVVIAMERRAPDGIRAPESGTGSGHS